MDFWDSWRPAIRPLVFTSDDDVMKDVTAHGWPSLPETKNPDCFGPPLFPNMFIDAIQNYKATFYGFANADMAFWKWLAGYNYHFN